MLRYFRGGYLETLGGNNGISRRQYRLQPNGYCMCMLCVPKLRALRSSQVSLILHWIMKNDWFDSAGHFFGFVLLDDISHALLETNTTSDSAGKSAWKTILAFKGLKHLCRSYMASAKVTKVDLFWQPNARSRLLGLQGRKIATYSNICAFELAWLRSHQRQFSKEVLPKHGLSLSSGFVKYKEVCWHYLIRCGYIYTYCYILS